MLEQDFYMVQFNRQPGVAAAAFEKNPRLFLRNMYRTGQWLEPKGDSEPPGASIIRYAEIEIDRGELLMSEDELDVFVTAFEKGGFNAPCSWYRNFTRNWDTTENVEQKVTCPSLMIHGRYDIVPPS